MPAASKNCRPNYLAYEKYGDIAHIIVTRPNALDAIVAPARIDLCRAFKAARDDRDIRGILLSGVGDGAFIGPDLNKALGQGHFPAAESSRLMQTLLSLIENLGKPVAAAIGGNALGCWCEIALACTLRIATDTARFGLAETRQWPIEDETLDAYGAYAIGLVDEIVAPADLIRRAAAVLRQVETSAPARARYACEAASRGLGARFAKPASTRAGIGVRAPRFANRWVTVH
jgi:enoyl-CoA hydratase/carnithine racemase